jgi:hypothetical protein
VLSGDFSWTFNWSLFEKFAKWGFYTVNVYLSLIVLWEIFSNLTILFRRSECSFTY